MALPRVAISRPILTIMVFLAFILIGVISIFRLPVELYPNIAFGEISIIIEIRGGIPPTEVETLVTKPIEEAVSTVSHLEEILSISKEGESTVVLSFEPGIDMNFAALEVREKFARVKNKLPREAEKPIIAQFKRSDVPIVILAVTSAHRTTEQIRKIVDEVVKERIKRVTGVANVEVSGGRERKILVEVDQRKLVNYGVPLERVISVLGLSNLNLLSGEIKKVKDKYLIRTIGEFETVRDIEDIAVATTPDGSVVRLEDLARVADSYLEPTSYARINIRPVVSLYIQKESTENTIQVADSISKAVSELKDTIPKDLKIVTTSNQALFIRRSISNLRNSLIKGAVLIMIVLGIFLKKAQAKILPLILTAVAVVILAPMGLLYLIFIFACAMVVYRKDLRPILVVTLSIPISVIITFGLMQLSNTFFPRMFNLTINFITMFGLALGVGMLVDNSIVVFENILKKTELGFERMNASITGSAEMSLVIIASTLTTVIVFLPMLFVGKEMKLLYSGVAWTVTFSLVTSLFVALTMVPLMSYRIKMMAQGAGSESLLTPLYKWQRALVIKIMRRRFIVIAAFLAVLGLTFFMATKLGREFIGTTEQNKFTIFIELPTGTKLDVSDHTVKRVEKLLKEIPEVKTFSSRVEPWSSKIYVELVGVMQRKRTVKEVIDSLRPKVAKIKPAFIYFEEEQEVGTKEIILDIFGYDYNLLRELAISMATRLGTVPELTDVKIRMREGRPELGLRVDKHKAAQYNFSVSDIATSVHAQMRGLRATLFHTEGREVETIARLDEKYRKTFKDLHKLVFVTEDGKKVYLDQVSDFKYDLGPSEIWRKDKSRMIQVSANIGNLPLNKAAFKIQEVLKGIKFPENYFYRFGGNYPSMVETQKEFRLTIFVILALIYLVLASLFESYAQPFIIMGTVPLASIGAVFALFFTNTAVGMGALIGMMMLAGIVVNNGIILVDHINSLRSEKRNLYRVLVNASNDRLRPVLMTTVTTILGLLPMALDTSEGSNLWHPLAITVIGGLAFATPFTLLITPTIFLLFEGLRVRLRGHA